MAVPHPFWKKWLCYISCEWFSKPVFGKRFCVCIYDIAGVKKEVKREFGGKDGGFRFFRLPKTIAFIGLDGSGKTTQALAVGKYLDKRKIPYTYLHLPSAVPMNAVACRIRKNQGGAKAKEEISRCTSSARQIFFLLGLVWIYIFRIFPSFFLGRIVVADRWFYDELIHCRYRSMCSFPELYLRLIPRPALLFYLKEEPKTAFSRAKEQDIGYFERKKRLYDRLAKKEHADIIAVEGIDKTAKKVRSKIDAAAKGLFW